MTAAVLTPFRRPVPRWRRPLMFLALILYCALVGAGVALLPPQLMVFLTVPLGFAVALILWMLPDIDEVPLRFITGLFLTYIALNALWPAYIAMELPGLPWITPTRIVVALLVLAGVYSYATSPRMRREIATVFGAMPLVNIAFWVFWTTTVVSIVISEEVVFSIGKWLNNQIFWTMLFALSGWLALRPGIIVRASKVLVWSAILVALAAIYEYHIKALPWVGHIPSFLAIDAAFMAKIFGDQSRAGTDIFRVRGTFSVSLQLAEYISIVLPFILHQIVTTPTFWRRTLLVLGLLALLVASYLTNARSGVIGFFMATFLYGGVAMLRHWQREKHSLIGISTLAMLPVAAVAFLVLSLTWGRLHNMTYGGGMQEASSNARTEQWALGTPKYKSHPFGHGVGLGGNVLGYFSPGGDGTIDTYYLSLLLEYGYIGFVSFMGIFLAQVIYGLRAYLDAETEDELYAGPLAIALIIFIVIKAVLSSEVNSPVAFSYLGFLAAIVVMQKLRRAATAPAPAAMLSTMPRGAFA